MQMLPDKHTQLNHSVCDGLQLFRLFVYAAKNTGDLTTLYNISLTPTFSKSVFKTLVCDFT